jgi:phage terminase large subunit
MPLSLLRPAEAQRPDVRYYRPRGRLRDAWECRDREVITDGPAGTGKSRMWLDRVYQLAQKYPGSRHLICRKTRESLTEAGLVTFEQKVLPPFTPWAMNQQRRVRQSYRLPNDSEIVVGGLDKPEKLFSTEYDTIYVQEATELTEDEWELFLRALRNGKMPYQQIVGDCNPGAPLHWIKQRSNGGALRLFQSRHEDNPELWDERTAAWTLKGREYLSTLDALTGVRYQRLRLGLWVAAENIVYADWDPAVHLIDRREIPKDWPRYRAIDFGFTNPFCCQWWAEDPDGRLYRYRELYGTQRLVRDWAHDIYELSDGERIQATITDHDIEGRSNLERHMTHPAAHCPELKYEKPDDTKYARFALSRPAVKDVEEGIEAVAIRLRPAADGKPRLFLLRDSLVERDDLLAGRKRPTCTEEEIEAYTWDQAKSKKYGEVILEEPLKKDDHGVDAMRYMAMHLDDSRGRVGQAIAAAMSKGTRQPTVQERLAERRARLAAAGGRRAWR